MASGNVRVQQSSYTFFSDHAVFNIPGNDLSAWGEVRFEDIQGNQILSRSLSYSADGGRARLLDANGRFGPWIFAARRAERDDQGNYFLERARLSTCETDFSKYHLYGHRIEILPGRRLTVKHAIFRIGPVPVLYLPYYYYSLGERHLAFQIFPGQNRSEGPFLRTVWGYPFTDETYGKAYLDYLSSRGVGTGGEFNYYYGDRVKGSLYGFRIYDTIWREQRWNARLSHWSRLSPSWIFQAVGNQLSDDSFPNDFFREDFNRVVRDFRSQAAFTFQKRDHILRLIAERNDVYDNHLREFFSDDARGPRLEWSQVQSRVGFWNLEKVLSASVSNHFAGRSFQGEPLRRGFRKESDAQVTLLRAFSLVRNRTSLVPRVALRNLWTDQPQGLEGDHRFIQKLTLQGNLRQSLGRLLDLDLSYTFLQRLQDNRGDDRGREDHVLSALAWLRPGDDLSLRVDTAHQLPMARGQALALLDRRNYRPLRGEISWLSNRNIELFFREEYQLYDPISGSMRPLNTQSEVLFGRRALGESFYALATSYSSDRDDQFELRQSARFRPAEGWKVEGSLRARILYNHASVFSPRKADFVEEEALVRKEWRCWELSFIFRERTGVFEFLFNLELKLDRANRQKSERDARDSEWYPWRGN